MWKEEKKIEKLNKPKRKPAPRKEEWEVEAIKGKKKIYNILTKIILFHILYYVLVRH